MYMSEEQYRDFLRRTGKPVPRDLTDGKGKGSKLHNQPVVVDGQRYPSKLEARRHQQLKIMFRAGEIVALATQVSFRLPGSIVYVADFVYRTSGGEWIVEDAKGVRTPVYKMKKKLMKEALEIEIVEYRE